MPRGKIYSAGDIVRMLARFGIEPAEAQRLLISRDMPALKKRLKECWHKIAFDLHPDRGGDAEQFKEMSALYVLLRTLCPAEPPPVRGGIYDGSPVHVTVTFAHGFGFGGFAGVTTTQTWNSGSGYW